MNDWKGPGLQDLKEAPSGVKTQRRDEVWCAPGTGSEPVSAKLMQVEESGRKRCWRS